MINNESIGQNQRYEAIANLAEAYASLSGFSSTTRAAGESKIKTVLGVDVNDAGDTVFTSGERGIWSHKVGKAENIFESFENAVWGDKKTAHGLNLQEDRSPDDPALNPFDIYIMYGDFMGDDRANHTILKLDKCFI